jgi:hypothetical protein
MIDNSGISKMAAGDGIEECRAVVISNNNIAECLLVGPNSCDYALPFGYCFLCQHPRLNEIVENTKSVRANK